MKVIIQRTKKSSVIVNEKEIASIGQGLVLLVCMEALDTDQTILKAAEKILKLRIFSDENGKMNKSICDISGAILSISQFTLSWNGSGGNRPSFDKSMVPDSAKILFAKFNDLLRAQVSVSTGEFGADMDVNIHNDGPVTFALEF